MVARWAERLPEGFVMHVTAFGLMTRHPVKVEVLPPDLRGEAPIDSRGRVERPSRELRAEVFRRFLAALEPLRASGKLGGILMQFPPYVVPKPSSYEYLEWANEQLAGHGSASILAEAAHSWADAGNEVFLLVANRRSGRPQDDAHPFGYGREAYVWALLAALGLFVAGAALSVTHGVQELVRPEQATNFVVGYVVLAVSFVVEGVSLLRSVRQAKPAAQRLKRDLIEQVMATSDPILPAVFAEDSAALIAWGAEIRSHRRMAYLQEDRISAPHGYLRARVNLQPAQTAAAARRTGILKPLTASSATLSVRE